MILELDQGNSRLKWRLLPSAGTVSAHSGAVLGHGAAALHSLVAQLPPAVAAELRRVRLSCVGGAERERQLLGACREHWRVEPEVARVRSEWDGLRCAYQRISTFGSDRWLALLAARRVQLGGLCVVDAGSALTVDLVCADGRHLGGYILAGQRALRAALAGSTAGLPSHLPSVPAVVAGTNTEDGIAAGVLGAMVGLVSHAMRAAAPALGAPPALLLTGGDGDWLRPHLPSSARYLPQLVLDGLAVALP